LNLNEAVALLETVSDFRFSPPEKKPDFGIFENLNEEYALLAKTRLITEDYRNYLKEIAKSRELEIRESEGYIVIYDPRGLYITSINSQKPGTFFQR